MVLAQADILARMPFRAALARQNIAGTDRFAAELLNAQPLAVRIASVARGTACLFMCHGSAPSGRDAGDFQHRQILAVAVLTAIMFAATLLEDDDLVAARLLNDRRRNAGACHQRCADLQTTV